MIHDAPQHDTARILVIDDHAPNVELVEEILKTEGYRHVTGVTSAASLPALHAQHDPDLIILDLWMPGFDGFAALEQLHRRLPEGTYLPVLVLTADATPETRRRALALGARDFLTKPFDVFELLIRVANLLEARSLYLKVQQARTGEPLP
ncbi:response regulator [Deinococcus aquiradiocola]|uniref:Response regulator n=1 Tax=Deinococcus aquiradiocola TaxID=393059 RepID=A0A917PAE3_9DEIO|nr:response regulator [Deinococcus aquiradiocola]GGJ68584.1 response regulator [Deinococcus aquiradiocola]